ncbi:MAG: amidohydrolase family protein [Deltaproteobacteria bacterium]|nr:amidohydrolase family protein [Deltaproteobacteria bacterium]
MRPVQPPRADTHKPKLKAPPGACDTHLHVFGPPERYPLSPDRGYNPDPRSTIDDYLNVHRALGLERAVIVTGSANGTNNQVTRDAVACKNGSFKALALLDPGISDKELVSLKENNFTGFRIKENGRGGLSFPNTAKMVQRVGGFQWHVEFMAESLPAILRALHFLRALKMPYVFDHVAYVTPRMSEANPDFRELRRVLRCEEDAWVNLYSFYQESETGPPGYADMVPIVQAIIEARPDRVVWGSNWPHAGISVAMPNDGDLLDFLLAVAPDDKTRRQILTDNPAKLYGWAGDRV